MQILTILGFVLLVIGVVLIGVEMVLPGFGVPGISGTISLVVGILLASKNLEQAVAILVVVLVILAIMLTCVIVFFHSKKVKSPIRLEEELGNKDGFLSGADLTYLIGKEGITTTDLRPTGKCDIEGVTFEVRSENAFIVKGKRIQVIRIQANALIVRES